MSSTKKAAMIKPGEMFYAYVKFGPRSKTLLGVQCVGQRLGPFTAIKVSSKYIETKDRTFYPADFGIVKKTTNAADILKENQNE